MKVLNLYSCLGGNRFLWDNCEVTAVENDPELARIYNERFPKDRLVIGDAHEYLLDWFHEYDFIWSSPPCPTHSRARYWSSKGGKTELKYPDMSLYQEIIFLQNYSKKNTKWVVENVIPYYTPLIPGYRIGRHLYWTNFQLNQPSELRSFKVGSAKNEVQKLSQFHRVSIQDYRGNQRKDKILRNLVDYEVGKHIFDIARGTLNHENQEQTKLLF